MGEDWKQWKRLVWDLGMEMSNQVVVKVKREAIATCMTCPLCNKLLRDATTISECLHTCELISHQSVNFHSLNSRSF